MDRIPETSYEASCVYHTETGCVLPRAIRSSTFNEFKCTGLSDVRDQLEGAEDSIAIAVGDEGWVRAGILGKDKDQRFVVDNAKLSAGPVHMPSTD